MNLNLPTWTTTFLTHIEFLFQIIDTFLNIVQIFGIKEKCKRPKLHVMLILHALSNFHAYIREEGKKTDAESATITEQRLLFLYSHMRV